MARNLQRGDRVSSIMMAVALLILAGTEARADLGRVVPVVLLVRKGRNPRGLVAGACSSVRKLMSQGYKYHGLFEQTRPSESVFGWDSCLDHPKSGAAPTLQSRCAHHDCGIEGAA